MLGRMYGVEDDEICFGSMTRQRDMRRPMVLQRARDTVHRAGEVRRRYYVRLHDASTWRFVNRTPIRLSASMQSVSASEALALDEYVP
jgi:hypothetical protein